MTEVPGLRYIGFRTQRLNYPPRKQNKNRIAANTKQLASPVPHKNLIATSVRRLTINKIFNQQINSMNT